MYYHIFLYVAAVIIVVFGAIGCATTSTPDFIVDKPIMSFTVTPVN
jgi:hypothetical protein